jgi:hypothetical protein
MFGHQDNQNDDLSVAPLLSMDNTQAVNTNAAGSTASNNYVPSTSPTMPPSASATSSTPPFPPSAPSDNSQPMPDEDFDHVASQLSDDDDAPAQATPPEDLISIKQQALQQLSPLMEHLDQTPEEKFRTTMMMIQAADNKSLIPDAYQAAQQITDDKARAQALLDVINEINYFTQNEKAKSTS